MLRLYRRNARRMGPALFESSVVTIGNFDGMHRGHQQIVRRAGAAASRLALPLAVVLFEPQPLEFFHPDSAPSRLTRLSEKLARLSDWGVDAVLCLRFDADLASLSAADFISRVLVDTLRVHTLIVGDDFRFGRGRGGDFSSLVVAGERHGFIVRRQPSVLFRSKRLSSTRVREALIANDLAMAESLLGRPFSKGGCVIRGAGRGRRLGFPTVNMAWRGEELLSGVYVSRLRCDGRMWDGISYIGRRPFYGDTERVLVETHLFDVDEDWYGRWVWLDFLSYLRGDRNFADTSELVAQIGGDIEQARRRHRCQVECDAGGDT